MTNPSTLSLREKSNCHKSMDKVSAFVVQERCRTEGGVIGNNPIARRYGAVQNAEFQIADLHGPAQRSAHFSFERGAEPVGIDHEREGQNGEQQQHHEDRD